MQEDLAILLEWFEANGITELFSEDIGLDDKTIDTSDAEEVNHTPKDLHSVVDALAKQQNSISKTNSGLFDSEQIREFANKVNNVKDIVNFANKFDGYENFRKTANSTIVLDGDINSQLLVINDMPNTEDDNCSKIFGGISERLLNSVLNSIFRKKEDICFLNLFFWRLPGGRQPIKEELNYCKPLIEKIIGIIKPKFIVFCGSYGVSTFLEDNKTIFNIRGKILEYTNCYLEGKIKSTATYSPYLLLKNGAKKKDFWEDILFIYNHIKDNF